MIISTAEVPQTSSLSQTRLKEVLSYDAETGEFRWLVGNYTNCVAGNVDKQTGYLRIRIDYVLYQAHRLAWLYVHGTWPTQTIDHRDKNKLNNRFKNLRDVGMDVQLYNQPLRADSTSGVKGVTFDKFTQRWKAHITIGKKTITLGRFDSFEAAVTARQLAEKRYV